MNRIKLLFAAGAALLSASACSPEPSAPAPQGEESRAAPEPAQSNETAEIPERNSAEAETKKIASSGRRCGWLHNPTPGNWWLVDRDGQWVLGSQGREPVAGMDEAPGLTDGEWVETNGHYGHGCACMDMEVDPDSGHVLRISNAAPKPLAQCRADRNLPNPEE